MSLVKVDLDLELDRGEKIEDMEVVIKEPLEVGLTQDVEEKKEEPNEKFSIVEEPQEVVLS